MSRVILLLSLLPILAALAARWWCVLRVLWTDGRRPCHCDLARWLPAPDDASTIHRAGRSAAEFGAQLHSKALAEWRIRDPRAAASRENVRRFGLIIPPLSVVIAVLGVFAARIPVSGAVAIPLACTALAALLGFMTLPPELAAVARAARKAREERAFPDRDDEEAIVRCANAAAWEYSLPPVLRLVQHKPPPP